MANRFANFGVILDGLDAGEQRRDAMARHRMSIRSQEKMQRARLRADEERYEKESAYRRERDAIKDQAAQDAILRSEEAAKQAQANADREFDLRQSELIQRQANADRAFKFEEKKYADAQEALALQMEKDRQALDQAYYEAGIKRAKDEAAAEELQNQKDNEAWLQAAGYTLYNAKNNVEFIAHDVDGDGKISEAEKRLSCKAYSPEHLEVLGRIANKLTGGAIKNVNQAYHFIDGSLMVRDADTGETETIMNGHDVYKLFSQLSGSSFDLMKKTGDMFRQYYEAEVKEKEMQQFIENRAKMASDSDYILGLQSKILEYDKLIQNAQKHQESILNGEQDEVGEVFGLTSSSIDELKATRNALQNELNYIKGWRYQSPTNSETSEEVKQEQVPPPTNTTSEVPPPTNTANEEYKIYAFTDDKTGDTIYKRGRTLEEAKREGLEFYSEEDALNYYARLEETRAREKELKIGLYNTKSAIDLADLKKANLTPEERELLTKTKRSEIVPSSIKLNRQVETPIYVSNPYHVLRMMSRKITDDYHIKKMDKNYLKNEIEKFEFSLKYLPDYYFEDQQTQDYYDKSIKPLLDSNDEEERKVGRAAFEKIIGFGIPKNQYMYLVMRDELIDSYNNARSIKERAKIVRGLKVLKEYYHEEIKLGK